MCILVFSTFMSEAFLILRQTEQDMVKNVHWSSHKIPVILVRFLMKLDFSQHIFKKIHKNQISWKSVHWEPSCSMHTYGWPDGQRDRHDEANSSFCNFGNVLKDVLFQLGIEPQFLYQPVQIPPNNNGVTPKGLSKILNCAVTSSALRQNISWALCFQHMQIIFSHRIKDPSSQPWKQLAILLYYAF